MRTHHCRLISRGPEVGQTSTQLKYDMIIDMMDRLLLMQRQLAWKVPFPLDNTTDTGGTVTPTIPTI